MAAGLINPELNEAGSIPAAPTINIGGIMFAVNEYIMNGTVTIATVTSLIDKPTFAESVQYFKEKYSYTIEIKTDTIDSFTFSVPQSNIDNLKMWGQILPKELKVI